MVEQFFNIQSIASGILKMFFVAGAGYLLFSLRVINDFVLDWLNKILLTVFLPALIFSKIAFGFDSNLIDFWWIIPVLAFGLSILGAMLGFIAQKQFSNFKSQKEFISACAFQNAGYLPLALTSFVCSGDICNIIFIYIFLYLIGFNALFWGFMPAYLSKRAKRKIKVFDILNPPFIATTLAIIVALSGIKKFVPEVFSVPLDFVGSFTFYTALIILGAFLAKSKGHIQERWDVVVGAVLIKLFFIPIIVIFLLKLSTFSDHLKFFIFLEAIMPTAVSLVIVGNYAKADNKLLSGIILYSHALAVITIPAWLFIFQTFLSSST